jgi:mannose-6-phosphate isomerase-like protein (cupin superfamily)
VLRGSATLVTGGTAINLKPTGPEELRGSGIRGGETRELKPGDVVIIPNGIPHWFKEVNAPFLYYVVKVRQAKRQIAMETRP